MKFASCLWTNKNANMPLRCVVGGCSNVSSKKKGITVHIIPYFEDDRPTAKARRRQWTDFVLLKRKKWKPRKYSCICSRHFAPEDYTQRFSFGPEEGKRQLMRDDVGIVPVPRFNIGVTENIKKGNRNLSGRSKRKILREAIASLTAQSQPTKLVTKPEQEITQEPSPEAMSELEVEQAPSISSSPLMEQPPLADSHLQETAEIEPPSKKQRSSSQCAECQALKEENRKLKNRVITLDRRCNENRSQKSNKKSTGVQCNMNGGHNSNNEDTSNCLITQESEDAIEGKCFTDDEEDVSDPDYYPFVEEEIETDPETDADDYCSSGNGANKSSNNLRTEPKFIVFWSKLLLLFQICHFCKTDNPLVQTHQNGSMVTVKTTCQNPKCPQRDGEWKSQPNLPGTRIPAGNFLLCFAILLAGGSASKVFQIFAHMGLACITLKTYFKHQREKLFPTIYLHWKKYQAKMMEKLKALREPLVISGDGRHDSMGHSAKFAAYTVFCCTVPLIIEFSLVQRNDAGSSTAMEYLAFQKCMAYLLGCGIVIGTFISDRHLSIAKHMREKLPNITHFFDLWHIKKKIRKVLSSIAKESGCEDLKEWIQPCINHFHWSATSTFCGTGKVIWAKFKSFFSHVINKHAGLDDPLFNKCAHSDDIKPRKWLLKTSVVYEKMVAALTNSRLVSGIKQASPLAQTSCLEGFHSLLNHFCPKMIAYSYVGMFCRHVIAAMHFNINLVRDVRKKVDGTTQVKFIYPKFKNGEATVRDVRVKPNFDYVDEIYETFLEESKDGSSSLTNAQQQLKELTPLPMNTMLEKESKETALAKKCKRQSIIVENVPSTTPLPVVVEQEQMSCNQSSNSEKQTVRRCKTCKHTMKGHHLVKDSKKQTEAVLTLCTCLCKQLTRAY